MGTVPACFCECAETSEMDTRGFKTFLKNYDGDRTDKRTLDALRKASPNAFPKDQHASDREIRAIKRCCEKEVMLQKDIINPAHNCKDVRGATHEQIEKRLHELKTANADIQAWLHKNKCYANSA